MDCIKGGATMLRALSVLLSVLMLSSSAWAQSSGAIIQQNATRADACTAESTATSAGNAVSTVTLQPPAGQFVYVCSIYIAEVANAAVTGAAGPLPIFTSTGLTTNLIWWGDNSSLTIGQLVKIADSRFDYPLKTASPGTPFTIATSGGGQSTYNTRMAITGYFAP
jgi:hypothetical protein